MPLKDDPEGQTDLGHGWLGASCLWDVAISAPLETAWDNVSGKAGGAKHALCKAKEWPSTCRLLFKVLRISST